MKYIDCTKFIGSEIDEGLDIDRIQRMLDIVELSLYFNKRLLNV